MCRKPLDQLTTDEFVLSAGLISTPAALRHSLLHGKEVRELRTAIQQGAITEPTIRAFVSSLLAGFRAGQRFEHELALAALAVVLERRATDFAEEFLLDLAKLRLAEMPLCIRVARECLKQRGTVTRNKMKSFQPWAWSSRLSLQQVKMSWFRSPNSIHTVGKFIDMRPEDANT